MPEKIGKETTRRSHVLQLVTLAGSIFFIPVPLAFAQTTATSVADGILPWTVLMIAAVCGAIGGVVYELVALQGNIEWPHRTMADEFPEGGFPYAIRSLFDLGVFARVVIGAAAALIVFWVLPLDQGLQLVAGCMIAGSAGTAIFRSLQDRLLAALNANKVETLAQGLQGIQAELVELQALAESPRPEALKSYEPGRAGPNGVHAKASEIKGRVETLLKVAGK